MNLVLLVNKGNLDDLRKSADKMVEMQDQTVNGAFLVVHDSGLDKELIEDSFAILATRFKVSSSIRVPINGSQPQENQVAVLFGTFVMQGYSRFPGPWLVVDSKALPVVKDFMGAVERQHNGLGGIMTGKAMVTETSKRPVGPVVLNFPQKALKFLRYPVGQSWRERGQFQFHRCKFTILKPSEYLWNLGDGDVEEKEEVESDPEQEDDMPIADSPPKGDVFADWTREQLSDFIAERTGKAPHYNAGFMKLVQLAETLKTPA